MIFEIKYSSKYSNPGLVHQMDTLEELLKFAKIKAPAVDSFSPGISLRPTDNPNTWEIIVYDDWQEKLGVKEVKSEVEL